MDVGGASRGGRRRQRHDRSSDEFAPNAPRKSVTSRRKNKEVRENYKAMDPVSYSALRLKNWYEDLPRDEEIEGRRYWCMEQMYIYKDIYEPMKNLRPMQAIDVDILAENDHFEDAIWVVGRMGLKDIMKIQCDYSPELVKQFFATLAIKTDEERTMEWMSGSTHCSATLHRFASILGVSIDEGRRLHGPQQADKNALANLYTSEGRIGFTKGLLLIYSQLLRFFRATICPSGGNNDAIRGVLVDLMHLSYKCARDGDEVRDYTLDIMDFIFHEIRDAMVSRTTIPYAPYIQLLINNSVSVSEDLSGYPLVKHHVKKAYKLKPVSSAVPAPDSFMGDARSSGIAPGRHPDVPAMRKQVTRLSWFQRHILCMNIEIHKENYAASRERSEIKHTQAVILHKLSGDQGPPPQPPAHPGYTRWHSAQNHLTELNSLRTAEKEKVEDLSRRLTEVEKQRLALQEEVTAKSTELTATAKRWTDEFSALDRGLAAAFPETQDAALAAVGVARDSRRRETGEGSSEYFSMEDHMASMAARIEPITKLGWELRKAAEELVPMLWPEEAVPQDISGLISSMERAPDRFLDWKESATRAGADMALSFVLSWYNEVDLGQLQFRRAGVEDKLPADLKAARLARASAIADFVDKGAFVADPNPPPSDEDYMEDEEAEDAPEDDPSREA
ncbi:uncharacterized protein [Lolium perenne]|uniref:uncharacterized protein n=2 Tax=Lolium perenne TaxID=4522 RepID=UPI003A9972AC